jgi:hypothetical protein
MACFHPNAVIKTAGGVEFKGAYRDVDKLWKDVQPVPCGQCIGCRLDYSKSWAVRCVHEAQLYRDNCFITLTYDPIYLPQDGSLILKHFQDFMKRLRKRFGNGIRFFHCGEYGSQNGRPHYHAIIFNLDFPDRVLWKVNNGFRLYTSKILDELWEYKGFTSIGDVTFESAAYVARYVTKKVNGDAANEHYARIDGETGELYHIKKEYTTMSRMPGLGRSWYEKYKTEVYPNDSIVIRGKEIKPPKYYDKLYENENFEQMAIIKAKRIANALLNTKDNTEARREVKEHIQMLKAQKLIREFY